MSSARFLAERLEALPADQQRLAARYLSQLIQQRRDARGPKHLGPIELGRLAGLSPDPWQIEVLESQHRRLLLNCARQTGKSTITALLAIHTAHFSPDSLVLLLSPTLRQSGELFKKALHVHGAFDGVATASQTALRLELANGSRILSLPGNEQTIRGFSGVRLLIVDEAARVDDELYYSVRPMLAVSDGRLMAMSTPFGTRGWWYDAWHSSGDWQRFEVPASKCPRISAEFLAEERRTMGEWWFGQEYDCQFFDAETQPFGRLDVDRAFEERVFPWKL